jgi:hypothetical protein
VHLTRTVEGGPSAEGALSAIIEQKQLRCGSTLASDARFGIFTNDMSKEQQQRLFSAICFTETPLAEVHCLLDIAYREIKLAPYGLVFLQERVASRGVSPVLYFNNENADKDRVFQALCSLIYNNNYKAETENILPLVSVFGQKIQAPGATARPVGKVDFRWEREWRYPFVNGPFQFTANDVFVGLCPDDQIQQFETLFFSRGLH